MNSQQISWNHLSQKIKDSIVHVHTHTEKKENFWILNSYFLSSSLNSLNMSLKYYFHITDFKER